MAGRKVPPELTIDDSVLYLTKVKKAFHDEPAKFKEFLNVLIDIKVHRINKESGIARMTELIKWHPWLLVGLCFFLPKAKTTIHAKANKVLGQSQTIAVIKVSPELTKCNVHAYVASVKEAVHDKPAKYKEWINIFKYFKNRRVDVATVFARVKVLMKNHRKLLLGLSVFLPKIPLEAEHHITSAGDKMIIPPEDEKHIVSGNNKRKRVKCDDPDFVNKPKVTMHDAVSYLNDVKEAFHDEPTKYEEFLNLILLVGTKITMPPEVEQHIMSAGAKITMPPEAEQHITSAGDKMTISPEAEQHITSAGDKMTISPEAEQHIVSDNNKRKRAKCDDPDYDPDIVNKPKSPWKKRKRKGKNVSPPKKKVKLSKRTIHCKKCGQAGHNSHSCGLWK